MQKVSVKEFQRRIAELDAQYIIAEPKLARSFRGARLTLKRGTATPNTQLSDAEAQGNGMPCGEHPRLDSNLCF